METRNITAFRSFIIKFYNYPWNRDIYSIALNHNHMARKISNIQVLMLVIR